MNKQNMELNEHKTSLLKRDQFYVDVIDEPSDYVLVFKNPYDIPQHNYESPSKHLTILAEKAREIVKTTFNIESYGSDEKIYSSTKQKILDSIQGVTISMQTFQQELFEGFILLMQEYVHFNISMFFSKDYEEIFVKVQASERNLQVAADLFGYRLQFKDQKPHEHLFQTVAPYGPFEKHSPELYMNSGGVNPMRTYSIDTTSIYKQYDIDDKEVTLGSHFKEMDRIRLISMILNHAFEINELINLGFLSTQYPIHRKSKLRELNEGFASLRVYYKKTDHEVLRNYYGEKIALYFAWLQFYLRWLIFPSILGLIVFIIQEASGGLEDSNNEWTIAEGTNFVFVIALCISSSFFDQMWARREARFAWKWGCSDKEDDEHQRTEYEGVYGKDPVTGKRKKLNHQTAWMRFKRTLSFSVIFVLIALVIIFIVAIFWYKSTIKHDKLNSRLIAFFNAIQIKVFNYVRYI